jgi:outer membrane protein assembly factor BamB
MALIPVMLGSRVMKKQKPLLKGTDVRRLQQTLKHLGFFRSRVDGVFGENTKISVRTFQKAFSQKPTGVVDDKTIKILKLLLKFNLANWVTFQRDFNHSGHSRIPIPVDLILSGHKKIAGIISINYYKDKLIITMSSGVSAFDRMFKNTIWENMEIMPKGHSTIWDHQILTPSGYLAVIDIFSGKIIKRVDVSQFTSPVTVNKGVVYASSDTGVLYAFDQKHHVLWKYRADGTICPPCVGYDNIYFASSNGTVYCLDDNGMLNWRTKISDIIVNPISVHDGKVFVTGYSNRTHAINPITGEIMWKRNSDTGELTVPAFHDDFMLLANDMCRVFAISTQSADIKWKFELRAPPSTPPVVCNDTAFFGTENGLIAYDLIRHEDKTYLCGEKITALAQGSFDIYVASESRLFRLSPKTTI